MGSTLPNPNARRRNARPLGEWIELPERNEATPPAPPPWLILPKAAKEWWAWAWAQGVSTQWHESDRPMVATLALLVAEHALSVTTGDQFPTARLAEMRQLQDRLGLSHHGRKERRWRYAGEYGSDGQADATDPAAQPAGVVSLSGRKRRSG